MGASYMKPLIGVSPHYDGFDGTVGVRPNYFPAVEAGGGLPIMLPITQDKQEIQQLINSVDGIMLTGGADIDPSLYGEDKLPTVSFFFSDLDKFELELVRMCIEQDKPVFGICRGVQVINVALGGSLYQDIPTQYEKGHQHFVDTSAHPTHTVNLVEGTHLKRLLDSDIISVNSRHHQAIKALAASLTVSAVSDDGLIEAVEMPDKHFIRGVQWHPELMFRTDGNQQALMQSFVNACR